MFIKPLALIELRETGRCEFEIPEVLFDMDYPGQYMLALNRYEYQGHVSRDLIQV